MLKRADMVDLWNEMHCRHAYNHKRNSIMADFCETWMLKAKETYYKVGEPIMNDEAYDMLERNLMILRPDSKILQKVGY